LVNANDRVVVLSTGSGLKDVASVMKAVDEQPSVVEPSLAAVKRVLR
jgi:threonine synthase